MQKITLKNIFSKNQRYHTAVEVAVASMATTLSIFRKNSQKWLS